MTGRPDRARMDGISPTEEPLTGDEAAREKAAKPPYGADDGKTGGHTQGGRTGKPTDAGTAGAGTNAQSGGPSGTESDRDAPGAATYKKSDNIG